MKRKSYPEGGQSFNGRVYFSLDQRMDEYMLGCLRIDSTLSLEELQKIVIRKFGRRSNGLTKKSLLILRTAAIKEKEELQKVGRIW